VCSSRTGRQTAGFLPIRVEYFGALASLRLMFLNSILKSASEIWAATVETSLGISWITCCFKENTLHFLVVHLVRHKTNDQTEKPTPK
jgi:hypothetical protein